MSNHKNRLAQLEKRRNEQPFNPPAIVEIYGTRADGTQYLIERREKSTDTDGKKVYKTVIRIPDNHRGDS